MGTLFEGFEILCTDNDYILGKGGIVFWVGHYIMEEIIQGNTVNRKMIQQASWKNSPKKFSELARLIQT